MVMATENEAADVARLIVQKYPADCIMSSDLQQRLYGHIPDDHSLRSKQAHALRATMLECNAIKYPKQVKIGDTPGGITESGVRR
jgi:hypothetical protein